MMYYDERGYVLTESELRKSFEKLKVNGETECVTYEQYVAVCCGKNGTLRRYDMLLEEVKSIISKAKESRDVCSTWYVPLCTEGKYRWSIVVAWMSGYEPDETDEEEWTITEDGYTYHLNGKVAYQPTNSLMQEYEMDWLMPGVKGSRDVWDTELTIDSVEDAAYFIKEWNSIKEHMDEIVYWEETTA